MKKPQWKPPCEFYVSTSVNFHHALWDKSCNYSQCTEEKGSKSGFMKHASTHSFSECAVDDRNGSLETVQSNVKLWLTLSTLHWNITTQLTLTMAHNDLRKSWAVLRSPWFLFTYKGKMSQGGEKSYFPFRQSPEERDFETGTKPTALN